MTCSDESQISLSSQVNLLRLKMQQPGPRELLEHLVLVSVCENVRTNLSWLADIVRLCGGDVR